MNLYEVRGLGFYLLYVAAESIKDAISLLEDHLMTVGVEKDKDRSFLLNKVDIELCCRNITLTSSNVNHITYITTDGKPLHLEKEGPVPGIYKKKGTGSGKRQDDVIISKSEEPVAEFIYTNRIKGIEIEVKIRDQITEESKNNLLEFFKIILQ